MTQRTGQELKDLFQQLDPQDFINDLIDTFGIGIAGRVGSIYYKDATNGSDSNDGQSPESAFASTQAAEDACTDSAGDIVVHLPPTEEISAPIDFDKEGVIHVASTYGHNIYQPEAGFSIRAAAGYTTGPVGIVTKPHSFAGLEMVCRNTTPGSNDDGTDSSAALFFAGEGGGVAGGFSWVRFCRFVNWYSTFYGIELGAGAYNRIERCMFEGFSAGNNTGIQMSSTTSNNPESNVVTGNWFRDCAYGIQHRAGATPHNFRYHGNWFVDSKGVNFNNQAADGLVSGNWFETATDAATYDITVAAAQALGINFSGNYYSE
jgi:hypothetical protein